MSFGWLYYRLFIEIGGKKLKNIDNSFDGIAGLFAMSLSAIALVAVVVQLAAGPFTPQPTVEENIADLIIGVKEAVERRATGQSAPAPEHQAWDLDRILIAASICMAGVAMLFGIFALARKEPKLPALIGFALGAGTLFVVWLQWFAFMVLGVLLLIAIIGALGGDISL